MKKISTFVLMTFVCCLSAMAQVELGDIKFSLGEGKKISPTTGKIVVNFPNANVDDKSTTFTIAGSFGDDAALAIGGMEGNFNDGVTLEIADWELQPATDYTLTISSVMVDGTECAATDGYVLHFTTRGAERKMSWVFTIDQQSAEAITAAVNASETRATEFWSDVNGNKDERTISNDNLRYYTVSRNYEPLMIDATTELPMTEDLVFKIGNDKVYVGNTQEGKTAHVDRLGFNNNNLDMVIPDCMVGDVITFEANRATKASDTKFTCIQALNGAAIAPDGVISSTGIQDSIQLGSSFANFKFKVQTAGDITFRFSNCLLKSISIEENVEEKPCTYNVVAGYTVDGETKVLKELVEATEAISGSTVKAFYPFWLKDTDGNVYTHGTRGNDFFEALDLKGDTTFVINYTKTAYEGAVYLSEGEDIEGAILCGSGNAVQRSSMGKAAYFAEDVELTTLQPGTYQIRAVIFDATSTLGYNVVVTKGEGEENEIYLTATQINFDDKVSDLITITEPTVITLKAGGSDMTGLDCILIYASTDAPDDPSGIENAKTATEKVATRKVIKGGKIVIETKNGTFNVAGVQQK